MFKVKCTGKNLNYGQKDEVRYVADTYVSAGLKNHWFEVISYVGSGKADTKFSLERTLDSLNKNIAILEMKRKMIINKLNTGVYVKRR